MAPDKILEMAGIDAGILNKNLAKLTIKGIIKEINGNIIWRNAKFKNQNVNSGIRFQRNKLKNKSF